MESSQKGFRDIQIAGEPSTAAETITHCGSDTRDETRACQGMEFIIHNDTHLYVSTYDMIDISPCVLPVPFNLVYWT